ncbi:MAG: hypothetical protein FVQ80_03805 [Planctomycetes bacterium]|nr:hypothetical protein [Planctomycetota bacterium]
MIQDNLQNQILRKMTPQQKLDAALNLYYSARKLKAAWLTQIHKDWSKKQVEQKVKEIFADVQIPLSQWEKARTAT